ncbi:presenilin-associated rhomboid-like protein, mitochondrial [Euwallacea similis]|uniref:presenilin-associated rhomboid-like protein, mitochondrial n=1 Tax=Euwallacea similis TaxID=1736056 RepID=UPI00344E358C
MALNQIGRFWFCTIKSPFSQNSFNPYKKGVRHFRKGRNDVRTQEAFKLTSGSLETPFSNVHMDSANLSMGRLWKPFIFTIGFSGATFLGCSLWEYENMRSHVVNMLKKPVKFFNKQSEFGLDKTNNLTKEVKKWWNSLTAGQKVFVPICILNVVVFATWRIPRLNQFMLNFFASNPASPHQCLPMIFSTFSHYSGFHLLANMYVLHSFSTGAVHSLGKEQFMALYLSAGVISSFTSYLYKILRKQPGLSLGASGSIMAVLGYVCMQFPETQLGIILIPLFTFSAGTAIKFIVGLDTAGVLMGWKFFDHAAHLGGAATGIIWALWGNQHVWPQREPILRYWHQLRGSIK